MNVRETQLPGIGRKFQADLRSGERIVVVIHDEGRREIYQFDRKDLDESIASFDLDDDEARQLAGIVGGMVYTPRALERVEMAFDALVIEWHKVEEGSRAEGSTIGELGVRKNFGATIVAVIGDGEQIINPGPEVSIRSGTTLVVAGEREQVAGFQAALTADRS
ncbi:cation:proton antiporter regulatory subunit [Rubrobacter indicoceani]|uniref:cation:proton antiporter regulatory subunit n=1 Tax=Rubrobacter indicoceani TaxID=2051957 RepID=UPI000E5A5502|nr:cation:proton antiporter regulatory subunit [Rubrobacter indicoceani]